MIGASKILTVSYGTFSCTLEGFDDPFNTMKAIAEYFRDLAAGDRYFGAEPPVPDAAMLHRIAEREIHRRVEAKIQDNGVILRAGDATESPVVETPRPTVQDSDSTAETVAARLQRIRARHADQVKAASVSSLTAASDQDEVYNEDEHAEAPAVLAGVDAKVSSDLIETPDQIEGTLDEAENDQALADFDSSLGDASSAQSDAAFDIPEALVAKAVAVEEPAVSDLELLIESDDQIEDLEIEDAILADLQEDRPEALSGELSEISPVAYLASESDADFVEDMPEAFSSLADNTEEPIELPEDLATIGTGFDEDDMLSRLAMDAADAQIASEATFVEQDPAEDDDLTLQGLDFVIDEIDQSAATPQPTPILAEAEQVVELQEETTPEPQVRARARVIRIRRADAPVVASHPSAAATAVLSDEAEAALQAELAALEAEIGEDFDEVPKQASVDEPEVGDESIQLDEVDAEAEEFGFNTEGAGVIGPQPKDESISRLMAQAESQMEGEETRRRQSAIAHLKAAVAATQADRSIANIKESDTQEAMEAYRDDLERVVRPRRPMTESTAQRPAAPSEPGARPTPLVLVSAQRIDHPKTAAPAPEEFRPRVVMPVRPRRVSSGGQALAQENHVAPVMETVTTTVVARPASELVMQEFDQVDAELDDVMAPGESDNVFGDAAGFQEFADQLGATALPELLEAAAVYCAEVLQRPEFSRPLIMRQIAGLPSLTGTAREDYLRGFGALLRQGRIAKVKRGMFALTDRSPYLAEARKLAG